MNQARYRFAALLAVSWLGGCAMVYEGKYDWDQGWDYAEVAYQTEGRWLRHRVVPIPQGATIKEGQTVYINVRSCGSLVTAGVRSS